MNKPQNRIFLFFGILSLLIIFAIVISGTLKGRYSFFFKKSQGSLVLGIQDKIPSVNFASDQARDIFESAVSKSKQEIAKQVSLNESKIRESVEKQVSEMAASEIKSIQTKICRDWGVLKE